MLADIASLSKFPKLFLRLLTKSQTSDFPMTLAKWFFENSLIDSKGLEFYHRHWEFLRVLGQNPPLSARIFHIVNRDVSAFLSVPVTKAVTILAT